MTGTRREIYHIVAATKEAAIEKAVDANYEPQDHTREVYDVEEIEFYAPITA